MIKEEPTLLFFRYRVNGWPVSVASSLQSVETSFMLIALRRYPHALVTCTSAIEGALQASNAFGQPRGGLGSLVRAAAQTSSSIREFEGVDRLRQARNRIVHEGFSPRDDSEASVLYLDVASPFLALCYREFHDFNLLDGLLAEYADHLHVARRVLGLAKDRGDLDLSYCLHSFGHMLRWIFKREFSVSWELECLEANENLDVWNRRCGERSKLEQLLSPAWSFDCPICGEFELVAGLDADMLERYEVIAYRMICSNCGFAVLGDKPYLGQVLLENQVNRLREQILKEYGVMAARERQ